MSLSQDHTLPTSGRNPFPDRAGTNQPIVWILLIAGGLFLVGLLALLIAVDFYFATSCWKVGLLVVALSIFVLTTIPGALHLLGHPWADIGYRRPLRERVNHPRLAGLAWIWLGIAVYGWFSVITLQYPLYHLSTLWLAILVGFGPLFAAVVFERRR